MYIFRIIDMVNRTNANGMGEDVAYDSFSGMVVSDPQGHPAKYQDSTNYFIGQQVVSGTLPDNDGAYIYTSAANNNSDRPEWNYIGMPADAAPAGYNKGTWLRTAYANRVKMVIPESGGITESVDASISGGLAFPSGGNPSGFAEHTTAGTCILFCGLLAEGVTVNLWGITGLDESDTETGIGNPETSGLNTAVTLSSETFPSGGFFTYEILQSTKATSTYCAGAYLGTWSRLGITQWTDHKKQVNDYSRQEQDVWGTYTLVKKRTGRTYSAKVLLTTREDSTPNDYDYNIVDLCFSVDQLLQSVLGRCSAFYFNNQDIKCPWIPGNSVDGNPLVKLNDSDIIVGVLQSFEISDIQGDHAVLTLSVNSVPNEYQNYKESEPAFPEVSSGVGGLVPCTIESTLPIGIRVAVGETDTSTKLAISPTNGSYTIVRAIFSDITQIKPWVELSLVGDTLSVTGLRVVDHAISVTYTLSYWAENHTMQEIELSPFLIAIVQP